jgi:hypothetical protein
MSAARFIVHGRVGQALHSGCSTKRALVGEKYHRRVHEILELQLGQVSARTKQYPIQLSTQ